MTTLKDINENYINNIMKYIANEDNKSSLIDIKFELKAMNKTITMLLKNNISVKTRKKSPVNILISILYKNITPDNKLTYNFNDLAGYRKFAHIIKYKFSMNQMDTNSNNFDINTIISEISKLDIHNLHIDKHNLQNINLIS